MVPRFQGQHQNADPPASMNGVPGIFELLLRRQADSAPAHMLMGQALDGAGSAFRPGISLLGGVAV